MLQTSCFKQIQSTEQPIKHHLCAAKKKYSAYYKGKHWQDKLIWSLINKKYSKALG